MVSLVELVILVKLVNIIESIKRALCFFLVSHNMFLGSSLQFKEEIWSVIMQY